MHPPILRIRKLTGSDDERGHTSFPIVTTIGDRIPYIGSYFTHYYILRGKCSNSTEYVPQDGDLAEPLIVQFTVLLDRLLLGDSVHGGSCSYVPTVTPLLPLL